MPSLVCPDCGQPHALDSVGDAPRFHCRGCGRPLKVPARFIKGQRKGAGDAPDPGALATGSPESNPGALAKRSPAPDRGTLTTQAPVLPASTGDPDPAATSVAPAVGAPPVARTRSRRAAPGPRRVPLWLRLIIWLLAIPLGAMVVFGAAGAVGALSSRQLLDTFLESGADRFVAVARLLPLWALVSAALVHFSVMAIAHGLPHRRGASADRESVGSGQARVEREPERSGS